MPLALDLVMVQITIIVQERDNQPVSLLGLVVLALGDEACILQEPMKVTVCLSLVVTLVQIDPVPR